MNVLRIRAHTRFAVCQPACLESETATIDNATVVELSLDGCRIANTQAARLEAGDTVSVSVTGADPFGGTVRWISDGVAGLKLVRPFHADELTRMVRICRGEGDDGLRMHA